MEFRDRIGALVSGESTLGNLGLGLLSNSGPVPEGTRSTGQVFANAANFAQQRNLAYLENQMIQQRAAEAQKRAQQIEAQRRSIFEMINRLGPQTEQMGPGVQGPPQTLPGQLTPQQIQYLQTAATVNPSAALSQLGGLVFNQGQSQPQIGASPLGKLYADLDVAETQGNTEAVSAIRQTIQNQLAPAGVEVDFNDVRAMRNDFIRQSQTFAEQRRGFESLRTAAANPSPGNDLALLFSVAKVLDPGSIVRDGEIQLTSSAGSAAQQIAGSFKEVFLGEKLTESQRRDFVNMAESQFAIAQAQQTRMINDAGHFAARHGFAVEDLVPEYLNPGQQSGGNNTGAPNNPGLFGSVVQGAGDLAAGAVNALTPQQQSFPPTTGVIQRGPTIELGNGVIGEWID